MKKYESLTLKEISSKRDGSVTKIVLKIKFQQPFHMNFLKLKKI